MPLYISLEANEHFDEFEIYENSLHINSIKEPVAECTDKVQDFLDNFGFLDDLAPFNEKNMSSRSSTTTTLYPCWKTQQRPHLPCPFQIRTHLLGTYQFVPTFTILKTSASILNKTYSLIILVPRYLKMHQLVKHQSPF